MNVDTGNDNLSQSNEKVVVNQTSQKLKIKKGNWPQRHAMYITIIAGTLLLIVTFSAFYNISKISNNIFETLGVIFGSPITSIILLVGSFILTIPRLHILVIHYFPTMGGIAIMILGITCGYLIDQKFSWKVAFRAGLLISFITGYILQLISILYSLLFFPPPFVIITMIGILTGIIISEIIKNNSSPKT